VFMLARQHGMVPCDALVGCMLAAAVQLGSPSSVLKVWQELQESRGALGLGAQANLLFSLSRWPSSRPHPLLPGFISHSYHKLRCTSAFTCYRLSNDKEDARMAVALVDVAWSTCWKHNSFLRTYTVALSSQCVLHTPLPPSLRHTVTTMYCRPLASAGTAPGSSTGNVHNMAAHIVFCVAGVA
jgi:hypothetical protein